MSSLNDQFEHGRLPLRPLSYENRKLAQPDELLIDYGNTGDENYHIYIADTKDPSKLIDITEMMVQKMLPSEKLNVDQFEITLEGEKDPSTLKDIINYIYKRFIWPENYGIFDYARDSYKLFDSGAINTLLRDAQGDVILPVTFADNVFYKNGKTLQDNFNESTRLGIKRTTFYTKANTKAYTFDYPFNNYMDDIDVRWNSVYLDASKYSITPNINNDGNFSSGTITLISDGAVGNNEQVDLIFTYNAKAYQDSKYEYMDGKNISIRSIPSSRLEKTSNEYSLDDETSIATSKALYNLYLDIVELLDNNSMNVSYNVDMSGNSRVIKITSDTNIVEEDYFLCNVLLDTKKRFDSTAVITYGTSSTKVDIVDAVGKDLTRGLPAGKIAKFLWIKSENKLKLITSDLSNLRSSRWVYKCLESEKTICYCGMNYELGACITVYKNGLRLFEDIDYSINTKDETITLFNQTTDGDVIVFEALYL
jgi:hypothetical protein